MSRSAVAYELRAMDWGMVGGRICEILATADSGRIALPGGLTNKYKVC